jgi:hypothetical protein
MKIMGDVFVAVPAIDVQKINASIGHELQCIIEGRAQQGGKRRIATVVKRTQIAVDGIVIEPGMLVALPGIHRQGPSAEIAAQYRLAKSRVGDAVMCAQFDNAGRAVCCHQPMRERNMPIPGTFHAQPARLPEHGIEHIGGDGRDVGLQLVEPGHCARTKPLRPWA